MAVQSYESAASLFMKDNKQSNANTCNVKVATLLTTGDNKEPDKELLGEMKYEVAVDSSPLSSSLSLSPAVSRQTKCS
jgi:phosphotransacetylase